jgi:hypothetical protein
MLNGDGGLAHETLNSGELNVLLRGWGGCGTLIVPRLSIFMSMRRLTFLIAVALCAFPLAMRAQGAPAHARDGGTNETLISIDVPSLPNAPFLATVVTEWTRILPDGSTQTVRNHRTVARDTSGRVFQERRYFSPTGDTQVTQLSALEYQDPNRHELYRCQPSIKMCFVSPYVLPPAPVTQTSGPLPGGRGSVTVEDLGRKTIGTLDAVGSREVTTINAGVAGNQRAEPTVKEFWYSPQLGINLVTKRFDPHASGIDDFEVENIQLTEPDPKIFEPPYDYQIVRQNQQ